MRNFRCPNNCHVSDRDGRCPRCGRWLKYDGNKEMEEIKEKTINLQSGEGKAYIRNTDFKKKYF